MSHVEGDRHGLGNARTIRRRIYRKSRIRKLLGSAHVEAESTRAPSDSESDFGYASDSICNYGGGVCHDSPSCCSVDLAHAVGRQVGREAVHFQLFDASEAGDQLDAKEHDFCPHHSLVYAENNLHSSNTQHNMQQCNVKHQEWACRECHRINQDTLYCCGCWAERPEREVHHIQRCDQCSWEDVVEDSPGISSGPGRDGSPWTPNPSAEEFVPYFQGCASTSSKVQASGMQPQMRIHSRTPFFCHVLDRWQVRVKGQNFIGKSWVDFQSIEEINDSDWLAVSSTSAPAYGDEVSGSASTRATQRTADPEAGGSSSSSRVAYLGNEVAGVERVARDRSSGSSSAEPINPLFPCILCKMWSCRCQRLHTNQQYESATPAVMSKSDDCYDSDDDEMFWLCEECGMENQPWFDYCSRCGQCDPVMSALGMGSQTRQVSSCKLLHALEPTSTNYFGVECAHCGFGGNGEGDAKCWACEKSLGLEQDMRADFEAALNKLVFADGAGDLQLMD